MKRLLLLLALTQMHMTTNAQQREPELNAKRISRSATLSIHAPLKKFFHCLIRYVKATGTYTYTGLNEKGISQNKEALKKMFAHDLKYWRQAINHY